MLFRFGSFASAIMTVTGSVMGGPCCRRNKNIKMVL